MREPAGEVALIGISLKGRLFEEAARSFHIDHTAGKGLDPPQHLPRFVSGEVLDDVGHDDDVKLPVKFTFPELAKDIFVVQTAGAC
jgi:hypothetical protein